MFVEQPLALPVSANYVVGIWSLNNIIITRAIALKLALAFKLTLLLALALAIGIL